MMGETVSNDTQTTFLDILLDGVEDFLFRDLEFGISPSRNFDDHVEDAIVLVGKEGNIVPWRDDRTILFDENAVFCPGEVR